jgi:TRAP-type C4-dicarboxylate transport system permease small subunit
MNEKNITQTSSEAERQALDTVINLLLLFLLALVGYAGGYYVAMSEAAALVKTILTDQQ